MKTPRLNPQQDITPLLCNHLKFQMQGFSREEGLGEIPFTPAVFSDYTPHASLQGVSEKDGGEGRVKLEKVLQLIIIYFSSLALKNSCIYYSLSTVSSSLKLHRSLFHRHLSEGDGLFTKLIRTTNSIAGEQSLYHVDHLVIVNFKGRIFCFFSTSWCHVYLREQVLNQERVLQYYICDSSLVLSIWKAFQCRLLRELVFTL